MKTADVSFLKGIVFENQDDWEGTLHGLQKFDVLGHDGFGPFSFENEAKRNSDVIVEVLHFLFKFVVALGQLCN